MLPTIADPCGPVDNGRKILSRFYGINTNCINHRGTHFQAALQLHKRESNELKKRHHHRDRITRQAEYRFSIRDGKGKRLPRPHPHPPETGTRIEARHDFFHMVVFADRYTTGSYNHICVRKTVTHFCFDFFLSVARNAEVYRLAAVTTNKLDKRRGI
jgi:hypothetical protein